VHERCPQPVLAPLILGQLARDTHPRLVSLVKVSNPFDSCIEFGVEVEIAGLLLYQDFEFFGADRAAHPAALLAQEGFDDLLALAIDLVHLVVRALRKSPGAISHPLHHYGFLNSRRNA